MDFLHGPFVTGRKSRILTGVDTLSRDEPVLDCSFRDEGADVITTLGRVGRKIGAPKTITFARKYWLI